MQFVLTIDDYPQTLATVRALGESGYGVYVGRRANRSVAETSRYASGGFHLVSDDNVVIVDRLNAFLCDHPEICCVMPIGERSIARLQTKSLDIERGVPIVAVKGNTLETCVDKIRTNETAAVAGLRVPPSGVARTHAELTAIVTSIGYPVVLKSPSNEALICGNKAFVVDNEIVFNDHFPEWPIEHSELLVQMFVTGEVVGSDFVAVDGDLIAYYQGNLRRTDRLDGTGFGVEFSSVAPEPKLFSVVSTLVKFMHYSGPGLVQCVRCDRTDDLYFLEVNPRFSAGIAEPVNAGVNLPSVAVGAALGLASAKIRSHEGAQYRYPFVSYWFERDLLGWLDQRRYLSAHDNLRWLNQMIKAFASCDSHINWRWRDPLPSLFTYARIARNLIRRN